MAAGGKRNKKGSGKLGIISDTHGLLRPAVVEAFQGVDLILHAGDIGSAAVFTALKSIAPVIAVRGNVDSTAVFPSEKLPMVAGVTIAGVSFFLIHKIADLTRHVVPKGTQVVIYGHSHKPSQEDREGLVYLNPGSAGPRRFSLPISLVIGHYTDAGFAFEFIQIPIET